MNENKTSLNPENIDLLNLGNFQLFTDHQSKITYSPQLYLCGWGNSLNLIINRTFAQTNNIKPRTWWLIYCNYNNQTMLLRPTSEGVPNSICTGAENSGRIRIPLTRFFRYLGIDKTKITKSLRIPYQKLPKDMYLLDLSNAIAISRKTKRDE